MLTLAGEMWLEYPFRFDGMSCSQCAIDKQCQAQVSLGNFCGCEDVLPQEMLDYVPPALPEQEIKLCECGCGGLAPIAKYSNKNRGVVKGKPLRFVNGHFRRGKKFSS